MGKFVFTKELKGVDAYSRHKKLLKSYESYNGSTNSKSSNTHSHNPEHDILRKHHKFVLSSDDAVDTDTMTWEQRLAKKYYDQLFKEYALCELSRYKQGHIALRWRTEDEVVFGKGQFICASMQCVVTDNLTSWEVNFGYIEEGIKKNELVKVRLCPECSDKLNYKTQKRRTKKMEKEIAATIARRGKRKKPISINDDSSEEDDDSHRTKRQSGSSEHSKPSGNEQPSEKQDASSIWSKDWDDKDDKTKDEEFEDYFADLLQ